jgi:PIN domain nuclease of toxin-antitoxin system
MAAASVRELSAEAASKALSSWRVTELERPFDMSMNPSPAEWVRAALRRSPVLMAPLTHEVAIRSEALPELAAPDPAAARGRRRGSAPPSPGAAG